MNTINKKSIVFALGILGILFLGIIAFIPANASAYDSVYSGYSNEYYTSQNNYSNSNTNNTNYYSNNTNNTNYSTPVIYSITPNNAIVGNTGIVVQINGVNFFPGSEVRLNASYRPTTYIDNTHLSMSLYGTDMAGYGTYLVTVYNPNNGAISNAAYFNLNKAVVASTTVGSATTSAVAHKATPVAKATAKKKSTAVASTATKKNTDLTATAVNGFLPTNLVQWLIVCILILLGVILWRKAYLGENHNHNAAPLKHA